MGVPVRARRPSSWRCVLAAALLLTEVAMPRPAAAQAAPERVLVLYSTRQDAQFSIVGEAELPRALDQEEGRTLEYYSEFLDLAMFSAPASSAFRDFLLVKYHDVRFDLVIAMQDLAIGFVKSHRDTLFRDTPVVFLTNSPAIDPPAHSTGLIHTRNFGKTVGFLRQLQPDVRNVFIVTGAGAGDRDFEDTVRTQIQPFASGLTVDYLSGLTTRDLERRLSTLPERSAVYYVLVTRDGSGQMFHPLDYVDRVAAAANAPTYSWVDSTMGRGIVGGSLYSQPSAIRAVGQVGARVLRGERPGDIPIAMVDLNVNQVDWRQLRRWQISDSLVPVGTEVRFREPTIWERYRIYILGALTILVTQTVLITGLLIQRRQRRRAENELRIREADLRRSYERNRDLGARLLTAQETERARIARELHDDICQRMLLLTIELESLSRAKNDHAPAAALQFAQDISTSLHELSHQLHPAKLRLIGVVAALDRLCSELSRTGTRVSFTHHGVPSSLQPDVMLCLFRVVQEALQNALKYSAARSLSVDVKGNDDGLVLTVTDDGVGFDVSGAWGKGVGLVSMVERLEAIGGTLDIASTAAAGTRVTATIPAHLPQGAYA